MKNEFGYEETKALASRLDERAKSFVSEADDTQSEGMKPYVESQEASLQKAGALCERFKGELTNTAKRVISKADDDACAVLLRAYGAYGLKEI